MGFVRESKIEKEGHGASNMPTNVCPYAVPRRGLKLSECQFYHTMDIPEVGEVRGFDGGNWDLRPSIDDFLGGIDFNGKRVLEVGPASGFLTFEMERRGGNIVSVEIPSDHRYDIVPYANMRTDWQKAIENVWPLLTNGYWFAHEKFKSNAQVVYASAYDIENRDLGSFDISLMSNMLLHNRDPLKIMQNCARLTASTVIVIDLIDPVLEDCELPLLKFQPNPDAQAGHEDWNQWWRLSTRFVRDVLTVVGFRHFELTRFSPLWNGIPVESFRVVARRT
jgi:SAM-dependent methyltransferase